MMHFIAFLLLSFAARSVRPGRSYLRPGQGFSACNNVLLIRAAARLLEREASNLSLGWKGNPLLILS